MPERGGVLVLQGIEQVAVEEGYPDRDTDLGLIDEDQKDHHGDRDAALRGGERPEWPDARLGAVGGIKEAVGDPGDLPHDLDPRHQVDQDGEDRDGQGQRFGRQILREVGRPQLHPAGEHRQAEHDGFG